MSTLIVVRSQITPRANRARLGRRGPRRSAVSAACALALLSGLATSASAQWIPGHQSYTIQRLGLFDAPHTDSAGLQISSPRSLAATGLVTGFSFRYSGVNTDNGLDAWVFDGTATRQVGLTGGANTTSTGYQYTETLLTSAADQIAGISARYAAAGEFNGYDAWVWNADGQGATEAIGFTDGDHTGSAGYRYSVPQLLNESGLVVGTSQRLTDVQVFNGTDTWVWTSGAEAGTLRQVGFVGGAYTGSAGYQLSEPSLLNAGGQVAGYSIRFLGVNEFNGQDVWFIDSTQPDPPRQVGLTSADHTGSQGYRYSEAWHLNEAGQLAGTSQRITGVMDDNGADTWVFTQSEETLRQIGLFGGIYTGSAGRQYSQPVLQNPSGQIAGLSERYSGVDDNRGRDAWVYTPATGATQQIGLTGGTYTGTQGLQSGEPTLQNAAGFVVGISARISGVDADNGIDTWLYDPTSGASRQVGLVGGGYTGSDGYRYNQPTLLNQAAQVAGVSIRIIDVNTFNGQDAWVYNAATDTTYPVGLSGGPYTGSEGYQLGDPILQNQAGQVCGVSYRIAGTRGIAGQDTWYFDPGTLLTSPVIGSIRTTDNFSSSLPTLLTDEGYLLGSYTFFAGGIGPGEPRAFAFRPDLGFTDLGVLVAGGLNASGWRTLLSPAFSSALDTIVGTGRVQGQLDGESTFIMVFTPCTAPPGIASQPVPARLCAGGTVSMSITISGIGNCQWQWRPSPASEWIDIQPGLNTDPLGGPSRFRAQDPQTAIIALSAAGGASLLTARWDQRCIITNACGVATSESAQVSICTADFNCAGGLTVDDLFDFLAAYFTADPRADLNASGTISVQDIFDYLAAYFVGCA